MEKNVKPEETTIWTYKFTRLGRFLLDVRFQRIVAILCVVILPLAYLSKLAFLDPEVEVLTPCVLADWALHPDQSILSSRRGEVSHDVVFVRHFSAAARGPLCLSVQAFRTMRLYLNGQEILNDSGEMKWKWPLEVDLTPFLQTGENELRIHVHNPSAVPALLVRGPENLRTPTDWKAATAPTFDELVPVVSPTRTAVPIPMRNDQQWILVAWLIACAVLLASGFVSRMLPRNTVTPSRRSVRSSVSLWLMPLCVLALCGLLNLRNAAYHPNLRIPDSQGHVDYVRRVAETWKPPLATDGWEMFQPPLYYYVAAAVFDISASHEGPERAMKRVQYLGSVAAVALAALAWLSVRSFFPGDRGAQWTGVAFAAFLPATLVTAPLVSNEIFSSAIIAGTLYGFICWGHENDLPVWRVAVLGFLSGLALLSKFTGLFVFAAGVLTLGFRLLARCTNREWKSLGVYVAVVLVTAGWFYARNVVIFGKAFVANWNEATGFHHEMEPGYRTLTYYLRFGSALIVHPSNAPDASWLDGIYASLWSDAFGNFFTADMNWAYPWMAIMLVLALVPTATVAIGFVSVFISALRRPALNADLMVLAVSCWTITGGIAFSMVVPIVWSVKGSYLLSLVPVWAIYLSRGRQVLATSHVGARRMLDFTLLVICLIAIILYRYGLLVLIYGLQR